MTQNEHTTSDQEYLESFQADLIAREAKVAQREQDVSKREAALETKSTPVAVPSGLSEADLDLSTATEDAKQGRGPQAAPSQRKAYGQWLRDHHPGRTPLKSFHVTLKKRNTDDQAFTVQAVDESDARRLAYNQAGVAQRTEGYNALVRRV
ncbi:hypothetical protein [Bremerella sp.]|uniref:hypothetical protein n=1 Tax=Bremerella sp. TaxID=2795602 RepID=UPI00391C9009